MLSNAEAIVVGLAEARGSGLALTHFAPLCFDDSTTELTELDLKPLQAETAHIYLAFAVSPGDMPSPVTAVDPASTKTLIRPRALPSSQRWLQV